MTEKFRTDLSVANDMEQILKKKIEFLQTKSEESEKNLKNAENTVQKLNFELQNARQVIVYFLIIFYNFLCEERKIMFKKFILVDQ